MALSVCGLAAACHRPARADLIVEWSLTPQPPAVGPATLILRPFDKTRHAVRGAKLRIEAQMTHPGMATVLATADEHPEGLYQATFRFTMAGDWILLVTGALEDGTAVHYRIDVPNVRTSGGPADAAS